MLVVLLKIDTLGLAYFDECYWVKINTSLVLRPPCGGRGLKFLRLGLLLKEIRFVIICECIINGTLSVMCVYSV